MSLINQMLKDLEKRQGGGEKTAEQEGATQLISPPSTHASLFKHYRFWLWLSIAIVLIIVIVLMFWEKPQKATVKPKVNISMVVPPSRAINHTTVAKKIAKAEKQIVKPKVVTPFAKSATLNRVALSHNDQHMLITFLLSQHAHYQLHFDKEKQRLNIILDNVKESDSFKLPTQPNAFVEQVNVEPVHDDLLIQLTFVPQTKIVSLSYNPKNKQQLELSINNEHWIPPAKPDQSGSFQKTAIPATSAISSEESYEVALNYISQDRLDAAIKQLEDILNKKPGFVPARRTLVVLLLQQHRYQTAELYVNEGLRLTPDSIDLVQLKARLLVKERRLQEALNTLQQLSPTLANAPNYYALMATVQQRLGNALVAAHLYTQLLRLQPSNSAWWLGLGVALESSKQRNAAIQAYQRAISTGNLSPGLQAYIQAKLQKLGT